MMISWWEWRDCSPWRKSPRPGDSPRSSLRARSRCGWSCSRRWCPRWRGPTPPAGSGVCTLVAITNFPCGYLISSYQCVSELHICTWISSPESRCPSRELRRCSILPQTQLPPGHSAEAKFQLPTNKIENPPGTSALERGELQQQHTLH